MLGRDKVHPCYTFDCMLRWFKKKKHGLDALEFQHFQKLSQQFPNLPTAMNTRLAKKYASIDRDPHRLRRSQARELLLTLDLPEIVLHLFDENEHARHLDLSGHYSCPVSFYRMTKEEQDAYSVDTVKPLLCGPDFYSIYAYDIAAKGFLQYDIESTELPTRRFKWEGMFISDVLTWWELELAPEKIIEMGMAMGLTHIREVLTSLEKGEQGGTGGSIAAWENRMIERFELEVFPASSENS